MPTKKFAISIPPAVMKQVDRAAAERGVTRSRFIADVLRLTAQARSDAEVTRRLNRVFADPDASAEQRRTAAELEAAAHLPGTEW